MVRLLQLKTDRDSHQDGFLRGVSQAGSNLSGSNLNVPVDNGCGIGLLGADMAIPGIYPLCDRKPGAKNTLVSAEAKLIYSFGIKIPVVWHCHIVEHEDNEMMRPYRVG